MQIYTKSPSHQYISAVDAFHIAELRKMYVYLHWFIVGHCPALGPAEVRLERFWLLLFYGQLSSYVCADDPAKVVQGVLVGHTTYTVIIFFDAATRNECRYISRHKCAHSYIVEFHNLKPLNFRPCNLAV